MTLVHIPVTPAVKDYLISNFGSEPIQLNEGNEYYWVLSEKYSFKTKKLGNSYNQSIQVSISIREELTLTQIMMFNNFALQRIHHYMLYSHITRPALKSSKILMDVVAQVNLPLSSYETERRFKHKFIKQILHAD